MKIGALHEGRVFRTVSVSPAVKVVAVNDSRSSTMVCASEGSA